MMRQSAKEKWSILHRTFGQLSQNAVILVDRSKSAIAWLHQLS
jgi:hypothetical protein